MEKKRKSTKHRKTRDFLAVRGGSAAGAAAPLSYGEERTAVRQCGFKRLRATAGQGPNYVGLSCGVCWPMDWLLAGYVGPAWGYVGLV